MFLGNYEDWGIQSMLIGTIIALSGVVVYLYKSKEKGFETKDAATLKALADKDAKIMEVINNHQKDLKEANNDMKTFVEKYHQFTQHLKEVVNGRGISK